MKNGLKLLFGAYLALAAGCSNTPYPGEDEHDKTIYYERYREAPKELDPQVSYSANEGLFLSLAYESLFSYDYWARPLKLQPQLATHMPTVQQKKDAEGKVIESRYAIELQSGVLFVDDPCFPDGKGRELTADDMLFVFKRIADPEVNCPVVDSFSHILGFKDYKKRLVVLREKWTADGKSFSPSELYAAAGDLEGIQVKDALHFDLVMDHAYPQMVYWLSMDFASAVPFEAVDYYRDREEQNSSIPMEFSKRPVGTGPFKFIWEESDWSSKIVLERNPTWWGTRYPERKAHGAIYPEQPPSKEDEEKGFWIREFAGHSVPFIDRAEFHIEKEDIARFNKFVQGYYDRTIIPKENFSQALSGGGEKLSPQMEARNVLMDKDIGVDVNYIGFNMEDDDIGSPEKFVDKKKEARRDHYLRRNQLLRQAMSLAISGTEWKRIFYNNLGVSAQSPLPPGIFGYDRAYENPYRAYDPALTRARDLLKEAGLENGIDPDTGKAVRLTFDAGGTETQQQIRWNFFTDAWKKLGLNVVIAATDYNKFQDKMDHGNFQIYYWGWLMDYPDPENFLFLLSGANSTRYGLGKPNYARFENAAYDRLFRQMEALENTEERLAIIREMVTLVQEECPWIYLRHSEEFLLNHEFIQGVKAHPISDSWCRYYIVDKELRAKRREEWNQPVLWPIWPMSIGALIFSGMVFMAIKKERR